jgi:hypothetical protein
MKLAKSAFKGDCWVLMQEFFDASSDSLQHYYRGDCAPCAQLWRKIALFAADYEPLFATMLDASEEEQKAIARVICDRWVGNI